ncbi:2-methoxy-6-polyprenyl-1,4-benzoquinol methylase, mitochondrial [Pimephales promelas]|uniref:2-methoxy-6-polyprenyl-1,4-benzoquinol methylase, mitochondrial n=1 Tax=Pimephales promelas TaxID=90988 RepID=UPI0019556FD3|nr:2-methoxy-6-polyprenyl-1,4-benzoquinol methylase, mitochondrial [Pimephales promelas]KAG1925349.1 S-adenosyl-L-methionine-dependent methyltransferases superfamily protein [Pimephales promelas]
MAASIRALRFFSDSTRNIHHVSRCRIKHVCCRAGITGCRGYSDSTEGRNTHFGFQTIPEEEKAQKVYKVFESVAEKYDVMNDAMSLGIHRLWKDTLLHIMNPQPGLRLLDTAGGTGDISFRFLEYTRSMYDRQQRLRAKSRQTPSWQDISEHYLSNDAGPPQSRAVVCDINKEMLKVGKQKAETAEITTGLSWVAGDAEELPFDDDQFDIYTIAFGIRNVTHIEQALQEALRVLKPGGRFMCLEFSKVTNPLLARSFFICSNFFVCFCNVFLFKCLYRFYSFYFHL